MHKAKATYIYIEHPSSSLSISQEQIQAQKISSKLTKQQRETPAKMMKGAVISVLAAAIILQAMAMQGEAVNCGQVNKALSSCVPFLTGFDTTPSLTCCAGVMELKRLAPTVKDKRIACECVKTAAARYPNIREDAASSLPYKCGVVINVPISKTTNCHEIN